MKNTIWCLLSDNNRLVAWWANKPSLDTLAKALHCFELSALNDDSVLSAVRIHKGETKTVEGKKYTLREIKESKHDRPV